MSPDATPEQIARSTEAWKRMNEGPSLRQLSNSGGKGQPSPRPTVQSQGGKGQPRPIPTSTPQGGKGGGGASGIPSNQPPTIIADTFPREPSSPGTSAGKGQQPRPVNPPSPAISGKGQSVQQARMGYPPSYGGGYNNPYGGGYNQPNFFQPPPSPYGGGYNPYGGGYYGGGYQQPYGGGYQQQSYGQPSSAMGGKGQSSQPRATSGGK